MTLRAAILFVALLSLSACGGPLSLLTGGGPNVAANVQAGKTNSQTVGRSSVTEQKVVNPQANSIEQSTGATKVRTERVETIIIQEAVPPWIWLLVLAGWLLDSPMRWPGQIAAAFKRRRV